MNRLNWQCCLAASSKTVPTILIFSIAMGADYSFEVKNIEIWVPAFFKHNNLFIATVLMKGVFLFFSVTNFSLMCLSRRVWSEWILSKKAAPICFLFPIILSTVSKTKNIFYPTIYLEFIIVLSSCRPFVAHCCLQRTYIGKFFQRVGCPEYQSDIFNNLACNWPKVRSMSLGVDREESCCNLEP